MGPIWQAQLGESLVLLIDPSWVPNSLPFGHQILGPLGKEDVCPNGYQICVQQFGNFRAKANPPKPRSCPKCPFGQWKGKNSSAHWAFISFPSTRVSSFLASLPSPSLFFSHSSYFLTPLLPLFQII